METCLVILRMFSSEVPIPLRLVMVSFRKLVELKEDGGRPMV
jgi:hypothetical protein